MAPIGARKEKAEMATWATLLASGRNSLARDDYTTSHAMAGGSP